MVLTASQTSVLRAQAAPSIALRVSALIAIVLVFVGVVAFVLRPRGNLALCLPLGLFFWAAAYVFLHRKTRLRS